MDLEYEYTPQERKLLMVIGEAYLGLNTDDYSYYKSRLNQAIKELEELQEKLAKAKEVTVYRAYKYYNEYEFDYKDFTSKQEAINYAKKYDCDEVVKFVYEDNEAYKNDSHRLEETEVYNKNSIKDSKFRDKPRANLNESPSIKNSRHISLAISYGKQGNNLSYGNELKEVIDDLEYDLQIVGNSAIRKELKRTYQPMMIYIGKKASQGNSLSRLENYFISLYKSI